MSIYKMLFNGVWEQNTIVSFVPSKKIVPLHAAFGSPLFGWYEPSPCEDFALKVITTKGTARANPLKGRVIGRAFVCERVALQGEVLPLLHRERN